MAAAVRRAAGPAWNRDPSPKPEPRVNDIALRLNTLIEREFALAPGRLTPRSRLHELGDSLGWLSLLGAVEDEFGIEIGAAQEQALDTVADLLRLLEPQAPARPAQIGIAA